jgi:hypothetical protein
MFDWRTNNLRGRKVLTLEQEAVRLSLAQSSKVLLAAIVVDDLGRTGCMIDV